MSVVTLNSQLRGSAGLSPASPSESQARLRASRGMSNGFHERICGVFQNPIECETRVGFTLPSAGVTPAPWFYEAAPRASVCRRLGLPHDRHKEEMKVARTVLLICALLGSLALPIFFLAVRHFHLETETAEWLVSLWPRSRGEVALEDRRAVADMLVSYGVLAGASMLAYAAIGWCALIAWRIFKRAGARNPSLRSE